MQLGNFRFTTPGSGLDVVLGQIPLDLHLTETAMRTHIRLQSLNIRDWQGKGPGQRGKMGHIRRAESLIEEAKIQSATTFQRSSQRVITIGITLPAPKKATKTKFQKALQNLLRDGVHIVIAHVCIKAKKRRGERARHVQNSHGEQLGSNVQARWAAWYSGSMENGSLPPTAIVFLFIVIIQ